MESGTKYILAFIVMSSSNCPRMNYYITNDLNFIEFCTVKGLQLKYHFMSSSIWLHGRMLRMSCLVTAVSAF